MKAYRYITGPDDSAFCRRITELLNRGWELAGPATLTFDALQGRVICGQPMIKEVEGVEYSPEIDLDEI
jgi:hypothetical protein